LQRRATARDYYPRAQAFAAVIKPEVQVVMRAICLSLYLREKIHARICHVTVAQNRAPRRTWRAPSVNLVKQIRDAQIFLSAR